MPNFSWIKELPPSAWKMSISGKTCFSTTLHEAALRSDASDADLIAGLSQWVRSRRSAEFVLAWDKSADPQGLLMIVRRFCPEALHSDDRRMQRTQEFRGNGRVQPAY